jgi:hypothetical protein
MPCRLGLACVLRATVCLVNAEISSTIPLHMLVEQADFIAVGTVRNADLTDDGLQIQFAAERVMKGRAEIISSLVSASMPTKRGEALPPATDDTGLIDAKRIKGSLALVFLKTLPNGQNEALRLVSEGPLSQAELAVLSETNGEAVPYVETDDVLDKVYWEFARAGVSGNDMALASLLESVATIARKPRSTKAIGTYLSQASGADAATAGLQCLLLLGDVVALQAVLDQEETLFSDDRGVQFSELIKSFYMNRSGLALAVLGTAIKDARERDIPVGCAGALARIHSQETLPYLASMLDNDDPALVAYGVGGLAMFANGFPINSTLYQPSGGSSAFRTPDTMTHSVMDERLISANRAYYVAFWKRWWTEHQRELSR